MPKEFGILGAKSTAMVKEHMSENEWARMFKIEQKKFEVHSMSIGLVVAVVWYGMALLNARSKFHQVRNCEPKFQQQQKLKCI